jgi:hypothetical protein
MQMLDTECAKATMGASFAIVTGGALTLFIAAPPNGTSVWVRVVDEVSDAVFEQEITADLPASTQFPSPWLYMNYGAIAAAVALRRGRRNGFPRRRAHSPSAENAPACFNGRTPTIGPVKTQTSLAGSERVRRHPRRRT